MSYDIELRDRVSKEVIQLPFAHVMTGGTYAADYDPMTGQFTAKPIRDAHLNVTYNYGSYYYEATDGDPRFGHDEVSAYYADGTRGPMVTEYGIRGIYGKTGAESIELLNHIINFIIQKYQKDGKWISTMHKKVRYRLKSTNEEIDFNEYLHLGHDKAYAEEYEELVNEGPDEDYWEPTAGNALKPLYQLLTMAQLRPDGVWDGD